MGFFEDVGRSGGVRRLGHDFLRGQQTLLEQQRRERLISMKEQAFASQQAEAKKAEEEYNKPYNIKYSPFLMHIEEMSEEGIDSEEYKRAFSAMSAAVGADEQGNTVRGKLAGAKEILAQNEGFMKLGHQFKVDALKGEFSKLLKKQIAGTITPEDQKKMAGISHRLSAVDKQFLEYTKSRQKDAEKAPKTREVKVGEEVITQEWRDGKWHEVGRGPRHKPSAVNVSIGSGKLDVEAAKQLIKSLPDLQEGADKASTSLARIDKMLGLLARGAGGTAGRVKAWIGPYLETVGVSTQGLSDAQLYERLASALGGSMRMDVIGPGPVSEYEQELLARVNAGGATGARAAKELLRFYRDTAVRKIDRYNDAAEAMAEESPMSKRLYQPMEVQKLDPLGIR